MIRALQKADLDAVADIWLNANLDAHAFIPAQYWQAQFSAVKAMIAQAEVYVYESGGEIAGFVGLEDSDIAGIFVRRESRSGGVGRKLLDFVKGVKPQLSLCVYRKNEGALRFYLREGFTIRQEDTDAATGEREYDMVWKEVPASECAGNKPGFCKDSE